MKILITAYGSDEMESDARRCGVHDFIQKPLTTQALEKSLTNLLERHQTREAKAGEEVITSK
jgi:FixJ family two-component response regulator